MKPIVEAPREVKGHPLVVAGAVEAVTAFLAPFDALLRQDIFLSDLGALAHAVDRHHFEGCAVLQCTWGMGDQNVPDDLYMSRWPGASSTWAPWPKSPDAEFGADRRRVTLMGEFPISSPVGVPLGNLPQWRPYRAVSAFPSAGRC